MANGGQIRYTVGFDVDKSGLSQIKTSLQELKALTAQDLMRMDSRGLGQAKEDIEKIHASVKQLDGAFERAFNVNLGTLNITKFNQELQKINLKKIHADLSLAGTAGQTAFRNIATQALTTNMQLKQTNTLLNSMATTMANTVKWGISSSVMNTFTRSVQQAYGYVKSLDGSLNDIRIVTQKSAEEMDKFAVKANNAAKALGQSTTNYTDAALIYYQQGLSDEEVAARAEVTLKAANVTGQSGEAVSEQLTAVWNGYKVSAEEAELYIDKLAAVAATTASDLEELSTGMSKVASAANLMGVDIDQLNAQLATIVSVTRQAPESVGTALKTIYARMGDIEAGLDSETTLGHYTEAMAEMGFNVLDAQGNLRDMGAVIEEIGGKWQTLSREQQIALSQTMAGTRQYNNLLSLFDNWDMYTEAMETSANAAGTLQQQQDTYMESTAAYLKTMKASAEDLYDSLLDADTINGFAGGMTKVLDLLSNFVDSIGGGSGVLLALGAIGTKVFSQQLANGLANLSRNFGAARDNAIKLQAEMEVLQQIKAVPISDEATQKIIGMKEAFLQLGNAATDAQRNQANAILQNIAEIENQKEAWQANKNSADEYINIVNQIKGTKISGVDNLVLKDDESKGNALIAMGQQAKAFEKSSNEAVKLSKALKDVSISQDVLNKKANQDTLKNSINDFKLLKDILGKNTKEYMALVAAKKKMDNFKGKDDVKYAEAVKAYTEQAAIGYQKLANKGAEAQKTIEAAADGMEQRLSQAASNANAKWQSLYDSIKKIANLKNITQGISSIGQMASAISTISNLKDIWSNEDLTNGERWLQIITNLGFALPMLATSLGKVSGMLGITTALTNAHTAAQDKYILTLATRAGLEGRVNELKLTGISTEAAYLIAANEVNLTEAQRAAIMEITNAVMAKEMTMEEADIAIKNVLAGANTKVAFSFRDAAAAAKTFMQSLGPIGWAVMALGAFAAIAGLVDAFTTSAKEAGEALDESVSSYKEATTELENLESQLKTTTDRIKELQDLANNGSISLIEEQELNKLKSENALLEAQIRLQEQKLKLKQKEVAEDAKTAYEKGTYDVSSTLENPFAVNGGAEQGTGSYGAGQLSYNLADYGVQDWANISVYDEGAYNDWIAGMTQLQAELTDLYNETGSYESNILLTAITNDIETAKSQWKGAREDVETDLLEGYSKALEVLPSLIEQNTNGQNNEAISYYQEIVKNYLSFTGELRDSVIDIVDEIIPSKNVLDELKESKDELFKDDGTIDQNLLADIIGDDGLKELDEQSKILGLSTEDVIETLIKEEVKIQDLQESAREAAEALGETTQAVTDLKRATEEKESLDSLFDSYEDKEGLTYDDISEIVTENPEYLQFLTKVGDQYKLNKDALEAWTNAKKEQENAIEDLMGEYSHSDKYNSTLDAIQSPGSRGQDGVNGAYDGLGEGRSGLQTGELNEFLTLNQQLNNSFQEGSINASEYFDSISDAITDSGLEKGLKALNGRFDETTDSLEETVAILGAELGDALTQSNKQFKLGKKNVAEYAKDLKSGADAQQKLLAATHNLTVESDGYVKVTDEMSDEVKEAAKAYNELQDAEEELVNNQGLIDVLTNNAEFLKSYTDESNQLMDTILDDSRITSYVESLSNELAIFARSSRENLASVAETLSETAGISIAEATRAVEQGGAQIASYVNGNLNAISALTALSMGKNQHAITSASGAIGNVLTALGNAIANFEYEIKATPYIEGTPDFSVVDGKPKLTLPTFGFNITGSGGSGASNLGEALQSAGNYFSNDSSGLDIDNYLPPGTSDASTPAGTRPGSGKSGGGGGGGGSKAKTKDPLETKKDRYHDVNIELAEIGNELDKIEKEQEKLFGQDLIDSLNKELELLEKQKEALYEKLQIAKEERAELQEKLRLQGVEFDPETNDISNYLSLVDQKEAELQAMIDHYNTLSGDAQSDYEENVLGPAQEAYEELLELMGRYDELNSEELAGLEEEIQDIIDKEIEINIKKFNVEVDIALDLRDAKKEWESFKRKYLDKIDEDDILGNALADRNLYEDLIGGPELEILPEKINKTIEEINKINNGELGDIYGDDKNAALEELRNYQSELMASMEEIYETQKKLDEAYMEAADQRIEASEREMELLQQMNDMLEHSMTLIDMLYGEDSYQEKAALFEAQRLNDLAKMASLRARADDYATRMNDESLSEEEREKWKEAWLETIGELNSEVENGLQRIIDQYVNAVNAAFKEIEDKITNGLGFDYLQEQWDLTTQNADMYLDTINKAYEIQSLENKINQSIDSAASTKAQRELNKLKDEELKKLREKEKLTQYDVDRANALYELKLKEIALEEAQKNKSQMRLRRDASGNYSYQFVADSDGIAQAQQEVDEAKNSLYNLDRDALRENQEAVLQMLQEYNEKRKEIEADTTLSEEQKNAKLLLINQQYNEMIGQLLYDNNDIRENLEQSYLANVENYHLDTVNNQIVPIWSEGMQAVIDMVRGEGGLEGVYATAAANMSVATDEYNSALQELQETAGVTFETLSEGYNENIALVSEFTEQQREVIAATIEELEAVEDLRTEVDNLALSWKAVEDNAIAAMVATQEALEAEAAAELERQQREQEQQNGTDPEGSSGSEGGSGGSESGSGGSGGSGGTSELTNEIIDGIAGSIWYWSPSAWGRGKERKQKIESKFGSGAYEKVQGYINEHVRTNGTMIKPFNYGYADRDKYKEFYYSKFDTGGYTGDWAGNDGRTAILHKKELVLNQRDTKNMLAAVSMVRGMEDLLSSLNDSILTRITGMTSGLGSDSQLKSELDNNQLEQIVHITADFPNVSSSHEIEDAFNNLINVASQYAFNNKR